MELKRNILLCVAGGTPAIITETLWALMKKGERVDEIRVITTSEGREKMLTGKLGGRGGADESLLDAEHGKFYSFREHYHEYAENIRFQTPESFYILTKKNTGVPSPRDSQADWLEDILTDEDNEKIANQICEIVRELTADENIRLHASIAGGRKTMSLYLMTAMQLFAGELDTMSHVLVSKEVEFGAPKFFYRTPDAEPIFDTFGNVKKKADGSDLTTDDVNIYLAEIPFVKLRGLGGDLFNKPVSKYIDFVKTVQKNLNYLENAEKMIFDFKKLTVKVFNREVKLALREFFVLVLFAHFKKTGVNDDGFVGLDDIVENDLETVCRYFVKAEQDESAMQVFRETLPRSSFIYKLETNTVRENMLDDRRKNYQKYNLHSPREAQVGINEAGSKVVNDLRQIISKTKTKIEEARIDERFTLVRKGEKLGYCFGLKINPDKIIFELDI